jgi:GNAT superfamily N-acetyltransferase
MARRRCWADPKRPWRDEAFSVVVDPEAAMPARIAPRRRSLFHVRSERDAIVLIRRYEHRDAASVRALFVRVNQDLAPPGLRDQFDAYVAIALRDEIERIPDYYGSAPGRGFWIVEDESGILLGIFGLEPAGEDAAELRRMYVAPEARRRGIARAMLAEAENLCIAAGFRRLVLSTSELQAAALALYRSAGYRLVYEEVAGSATNKTVGSNLRRFHFEKCLQGTA